MRVIFVTSSLTPFNGTGSFSLGMVEGALTHNIHPIVLLPDGYTPPESLKGKISFVSHLPNPQTLSINPINLWYKSFKIKWNEKIKSAQLLHCLYEPYIPLSYVLARHLSIPLVISSVGSYSIEPFHRKPQYAKVYCRAFESAQKVIAISDFTAKKLHLHLPGLNIQVVFPGWDHSHMSNDCSGVDILQNQEGERLNNVVPVELNNLQGSIADAKIILSVGAVKPRKGYETSIKSFAELASKFPEWIYIIIGNFDDKNYSQHLKTLIRHSSLENRILFLGKIPQKKLHDIFKQAQIFLLIPQVDHWKFEGFGLVFFEACAYGLPIICSDQCGFSEIVESSQCGISAKAGDIESVKEALITLMINSKTREDFGGNARSLSERYTWRNQFAIIRDSYINILTKSNI